MLTLDVSNQFLSSIGGDIIITVLSSITTFISGYILLRERLIKTEMKVDSIYDYINNRNQVIENRIKDLQEDLSEIKEIEKETSKSLSENNKEISELRAVLNVMTEKLQKL